MTTEIWLVQTHSTLVWTHSYSYYFGKFEVGAQSCILHIGENLSETPKIQKILRLTKRSFKKARNIFTQPQDWVL
jgi:hypothetical protein